MAIMERTSAANAMGIAIKEPIIAVEIPPSSADGSAAPAVFILLNAFIIPTKGTSTPAQIGTTSAIAEIQIVLPRDFLFR